MEKDEMSIIPKLNFDDFYKFIMSVGILTILVSVALSFYLSLSEFSIWELFINNLIVWIFNLILIILVLKKLVYWAGKKWYNNQKIMDEKLKAECELIKKDSYSISPPKKEIGEEASDKPKKFALVGYKVDSMLPGTVHYDLVDDGQVWFLLANMEARRYKVYIEVEFISEGYHKKIDWGHYGGKKEWNLNPFYEIKAPGMPIPSEIKELAKRNKRIQIKINCKINDENDIFIEKKLPISFIYNRKNRSWFLEP